MYGVNKLNLLMEKQHNRGQDGAGAAVIKLDMPPETLTFSNAFRRKIHLWMYARV